MSLALLLSISVFIFGAIIGSFLNVVIFRYNTGFSLGGRSRCFSCGKTLSWRELIPILSFLFQRGKCRSCKSKISYQYPSVEFLTGLVFLLTFLHVFSFYPVSTQSVFYTIYLLVIFSLLIVISVYDLKHKIIPDGLVWAFALLSLIGTFFSLSVSSPLLFTFHFSLSTFLSGPLLFLPFFLLWFLSKGKWMGFGDAKLALGIGWFLGIAGGFSAIFLAFYIGALVGIGIIFFEQLRKMIRGNGELNLGAKNLTIKSEIPFGPFLIFGVFLVFFLGVNFFTIFTF